MARLSGGADGGEVGSQRAVALFAGRGDGEHARDEGVARVGLGAEAAFTPEHGWPNGALGGVVGRRGWTRRSIETARAGAGRSRDR